MVDDAASTYVEATVIEDISGHPEYLDLMEDMSEAGRVGGGRLRSLRKARTRTSLHP